MLNFIQISDLHHHIKNYNSLKMRLSLVEYLTDIAKTTKFDILVVTGDLVDKGSDFTNEITVFLDAILNAINLSRENTYIVPGNHDLKRDETRNLIIDGINSKGSAASDNLDQSLTLKGTKDIILKSFDDFFVFYKDYFGEDYPIDQIHFIKDSDKYNIIHLNSCLVACKSGEEGSLFIGKSKLLECLSKLDKRQNKLNIAIGHHSLDCFHPDEINSIKANFEDYGVDMYLSGHVHKAGYHIETNGESAFINLVSGAGAIDDYAEGGFITGIIGLNHDMNVEFHGWHKQQQYWTINTGVGRKAKSGILNYTINRLKELENVTETNLHGDIEELSIEVDEDEFKNFIIDFHQHPQPKGTITVYQTKQKEIEEKFENMRCSPTFEKMFLDYAQYFSAIEEIMNSTSYIEAEKKEIVSEIIKDTYLGMHNNYSSGDEIFIKLVDIIEKNHTKNLKYSVHKTRRYIRILTAWCIYDCNIFNEKKSNTGVM